jgi:hypothetical protein
MSFFPNREQEGKTREGRGGYKEQEYVEGSMWWEYYVLMYENGKMRPVETIPGMGGRG